MNVEIIPVSEADLNDGKYMPNYVVFLMVRHENGYLLKRDFDGGHWELPASGPIERPGETPREYITRQYVGKYIADDSKLEFVGVVPVTFEKTSFRPDPQPEYLALFETFADDKSSVMDGLDESLHMWYVLGDSIDPYCQLCRMLIENRSSL